MRRVYLAYRDRLSSQPHNCPRQANNNCFPGLGVSFKKATFDILKFSMIASLRGHKQTMFIHVYSISLFVSIL